MIWRIPKNLLLKSEGFRSVDMATNAVIVGNRKLKLYFKKIKKDLLHKKLLEEIGHFVDIRIEERTLRGKDADGKMIDGYSKAYELIRQEKGLQTAHKDLFFTGSMYAALTHKTGKDKVTSFLCQPKIRRVQATREKLFTMTRTTIFLP